MENNQEEYFDENGQFKLPLVLTWKKMMERKNNNDEVEINAYNKVEFENLTEQLYDKWTEIAELIATLVQTDWSSNTKAYNTLMLRGMNDEMIGSSFKILAKIYSTYFAGMYCLQMENASIIMLEACDIRLQLSSLEMFESKSMDYCKTIKKEIDEFKVIFKQWILQFEKDEFEHEWGLW